MIKKIFISLLFIALTTSNSIAAGSSDSGSSKTKYDIAVTHIKAAKKFESQDNLKEAKKNIRKLKSY